MSFTWTVRNKLVAFAAVGVVVAASLATTAHLGIGRVDRAMDDIVHDTRVQRSQLEMDQVHDALRGDVLAALVAAEGKDAAEQQRVLGQVAEHGKGIRKLGADLKAQGLPPELSRAVSELEPVLAAYATEAEKIATLAFQDRGAALGGLGQFMDAFRRLERDMARVTDLIGAETRSTQAAGDGAVVAARWMLGVILVVALGVFTAVALVITRSIVGPLGRTGELLRDIAEGEGDLTKRLPAARRDEIGEMARSFNTFMEKLHEIIARVRQAAGQAAGASQELSASSEQLSSGAQEQASSLEETAASLEEITGTVKQNADNARQASQLAVGARDAAEQGGQVVTEAVAAMGEITRASRQIAAIITTIDEIAFQTNLLALNAAVEAARAGEQGRGFAVVASEVRNLAQRSATAAREIKALIGDSVDKVEAGSDLVNRSGQTLGEIVGAVKRVTDIIAEIAAASSEQSQGIEQVNRAVTQMDQVVQSNAAQTEELSSTAQTLAGQAHELTTLVGRFRLSEAAGGGRSVPGPIAAGPAAPRPGRGTPRGLARVGAPGTASGAVALVTPPSGNGSAHAKDDGFEEF